MFREIEKFIVDKQTDPFSWLFSYNMIELFVISDFLRNNLYKIILRANLAVKISFISFALNVFSCTRWIVFFGNKASLYNQTLAFNNSRAMSRNNITKSLIIIWQHIWFQLTILIFNFERIVIYSTIKTDPLI